MIKKILKLFKSIDGLEQSYKEHIVPYMIVASITLTCKLEVCNDYITSYGSIILKENENGHRKIEYSLPKYFDIHQFKIYTNTIIPWIKGMNFDEIPSYNAILKNNSLPYTLD